MNKDIEYINKFKKISINQVCKDLYLDSSNLYKGKMSNESTHKVRVELEKRISELNKKRNYRKIKGKKKRLRKRFK